MTDESVSLGYVDATKALSQHCRQDWVAKHPLIDSLGREQDTTFINEKGRLFIYDLLKQDGYLPLIE